jgi:hypothetical protein
MNETIYNTGNSVRGTKKYWLVAKRTTTFTTFILLRWSDDLINEKGVMKTTGTSIRLKNRNPFQSMDYGELTLVNDSSIIIKP